MAYSAKAMSIGASPTLAIDSKAKKLIKEGVNVISFGVGEPDFDTPKHIREAAITAINEGFTRYTPAAGIIELRQAICKKFKNDNNLEYVPTDIVVSNGAKHSLYNAFMAVCNPGDEVIVPAPYWVSYPEMIKLADGVPVVLETTEDDDFKITAEKLKKAINPKTKALVLNSPSNPTGMVYSKEELEAIAKVVTDNDLFVISDEIYEELIYDGPPHVSIASLNDKIKDLTIVVNGMSKAYAMTGWRIGYTASNAKIASMMGNVQSHATSNPNSIAQKASLAALEGGKDTVRTMVAEFAKRRDYMFERINSIANVSCLRPTGAFYVMMNVSKLYGKTAYGMPINNSDDFASLLLEKENVALVPGTGFGANLHVRLSYATSLEKIKEGLDRIERFVSAIK